MNGIKSVDRNNHMGQVCACFKTAPDIVNKYKPSISIQLIVNNRMITKTAHRANAFYHQLKYVHKAS